MSTILHTKMTHYNNKITRPIYAHTYSPQINFIGYTYTETHIILNNYEIKRISMLLLFITIAYEISLFLNPGFNRYVNRIKHVPKLREEKDQRPDSDYMEILREIIKTFKGGKINENYAYLSAEAFLADWTQPHPAPAR